MASDTSSDAVAARYLLDIRHAYRRYRQLAEKAIAQVDDAALMHATGDEDNSIAVVMQHVGGNLTSRFTDFLVADGEKPNRNRDAEFESQPGSTRDSVLTIWSNGWNAVMTAIEALQPADLTRTVHIRREPLTVLEALNRSITHTAYHVGQIVMLARHFAGDQWQSLSIPKGRSADYGTGTFKRDQQDEDERTGR